MHYLVIKYINWWSCMHTSAVENNEWAIKKKKKTTLAGLKSSLFTGWR